MPFCLDAPVFTMGPSYPLVGVKEGRNVTLTCKVKADPYELDHLHWYNNRGERIDKNYTEDFFGRCFVLQSAGRNYCCLSKYQNVSRMML